MPATAKKQTRFLHAESGRATAGQPTQTGMSAAKLRDYATAPVKTKTATP